MRVTMGRERRQTSEEEVEVGEERIRLKRCHASLGLLVFLNKALVSEVVGSMESVNGPLKTFVLI